jgi:DNA-binding GntR family transcriptional regulator
MAISGSGKGPSAPPVVKDSAYDKIKAAILDGTLEPGAPLVESSIAEWCGVSRTPVREALTRLEQDGLVTRSDRGLVVRERSPEEILDIYEVRIVLESAAARLAAERHTNFDLIRLERLVRVGEEIGADRPEAMAANNREFHRALWQAARNEALLDLLSRLNMHLVRYPMTTLSYPGRWKQALLQHRQLVDAIAGRDASKAAEVARVHFTEARDIRLRLWEQDLA